MDIKRAEKLAYVYERELGKHADKVIDGINRKDGHCPCELIKIKENHCPCTTFLSIQECRCGLFVKKES